MQETGGKAGCVMVQKKRGEQLGSLDSTHLAHITVMDGARAQPAPWTRRLSRWVRVEAWLVHFSFQVFF